MTSYENSRKISMNAREFSILEEEEDENISISEHNAVNVKTNRESGTSVALSQML